MNCEKAQQLLIEYIEGSLEKEQANRLLSHTQKCNTCQTELLAMQQTISQAVASKVPQPDDAFFNSFPDQVLNGYKAQVQDQVKQTKRRAVHKPGLLELLQNWWLDTSWPNLAAQAMVVVLAIGGTTVLLNNPSEPGFDSASLYAQLQDNPALIAYAKQDNEQKTTNHFGFADKPATVISYTTGKLYSESLAMVATGQYESSTRRLTDIEAMLGGQNNDDFIKTIKRHTDVINHDTTTKTDKLASLATLRTELESLTQQNGEGHLILFRAGSWLIDIKLTVISGAYDKLHQADQAQHILDGLVQLGTPKSILRKLGKIKSLMTKPAISKSDAHEIEMLAGELQQLLG